MMQPEKEGGGPPAGTASHYQTNNLHRQDQAVGVDSNGNGDREQREFFAKMRAKLDPGQRTDPPRDDPEPPQDLDNGDGAAALAAIRASRPREPQDLDDSPPEEAPPEFGSIDGAGVLDDLGDWLGRYIVVAQPTDLALLALWVAHTFLSQELYSTPRLLIDSITPGSGKTTLLEHLAHLCRNALLAASMSSAAVIPRILDKQPRTILLDEVQRMLVPGRPDTDAVIAVVNSGYRTGATRPVLVPQGRDFKVKELPTFAPVAMAGNSPHLPQDTMDRSIRILLMPDVDGQAQDSDWEALDGEVERLRERMAQWADSVRAHVKDTKGALPAGCTGRLREKWRPLMRVAELAEHHDGGCFWKDRVYMMAEADLADMTEQREAGLRQQPPGLVLLENLAHIWPQGESFVATETLIELLVKYNSEYWGEGTYNGAHRTKLNAHRLGRMIKQATNTTSRREGRGGTPRGYDQGQFQQAWRSMRITPGK